MTSTASGARRSRWRAAWPSPGTCGSPHRRHQRSASRCPPPGPAASLGIPEKNTFELLPTTIAGEKVNWIVLDDGIRHDARR